MSSSAAAESESVKIALPAFLDEKQFALMGVVNVTPDSFYDGGRYDTLDTACAHARQLLREGADILDIGGESSRPGSLPVSVTEELRRVIPVITQLRSETAVPISIDTAKAAVAREALAAGATWINDISAGRFDPDMAPLAAENQCPIVLMHSRKRPETMQQDPSYHNVVREVIDELLDSVGKFVDCGVLRENIVLDPGIGFAKRFEDNCILLRRLAELVRTGFPVLIGTSRKSFVGQITGKETADRLYGTLGSVAAAYIHGAKLFRVHDIAATKELLQVLSTIEQT